MSGRKHMCLKNWFNPAANDSVEYEGKAKMFQKYVKLMAEIKH